MEAGSLFSVLGKGATGVDQVLWTPHLVGEGVYDAEVESAVPPEF